MDQFQRWRDRLAGIDVDITESDPHPGYYRVRKHKADYWLPVAIWNTKDGELVARVAGDMKDPMKIWTWCAKNPVPKDAALQAFETGTWPDIVELQANPSRSNLPDDPYEALLAEVNDKIEQATAWLRANKDISTKEGADIARNMEAQIQELHKRADAMHKEMKAPHLEAGREVDRKFDFRKTLEPVKKGLKAAWGRFAAAEERRLREEAERKRKEAEAERHRIEAEAKKKADEDPIGAVLDGPPELPELPPEPDAVKVNVGGGVGSRGGLTTVWLAEVEDYAKAAVHYIERTEVRALIEKLANAEARALKEAAKADGIRFYSERRAR